MMKLGTPMEAVTFALCIAKNDQIAGMQFLEGWNEGDVSEFPGYQDFVNQDTQGHESLWRWFGLSRASFLTLPRILLHEMPDPWQGQMATLLREYEEAFPNQRDMPNAYVSARQNRRFVKWPAWLLDYRHPKKSEIDKLRKR